MSEWVPVADEGTLVAWTVVHLPILDGRTGLARPSPYGMGLIRLDGADTTLNHYLAQADPDRLAVGQRVRARWREELLGAIDDIECFEIVHAAQPPMDRQQARSARPAGSSSDPRPVAGAGRPTTAKEAAA